MTLQQRKIKHGEALAIKPDAVHTGPQGMWWDYSAPIPDNEICGRVAVVHVRGSLDHHKGYGCDSYESILERVKSAIEGDAENPTPKAVVMCLDSPGGVVSGLNETVFALRKMAHEADIPLIAYVGELAASAAYALACSCSEIVIPPSGICGSVGVISTMFDQVEADQKMGVRFATLTSGARKADGHPHVPISDAALNAEQRRVDRLAKQFFSLVSDVRPLSKADLEGYQAGIFLGAQAVKRGLADAVMGWDELIDVVNEFATVKKIAIDAPRQGASKSKPTAGDPIGPDGAHGQTKKDPIMSLVALQALVKKTDAKIASEKDEKKKRALVAAQVTFKASLEAYKKEKHTIEKHETEEGEEDDEDEESEESEESEEESEESEESEAKGNETDRKEGDSDDDEDDDDDDDDKEDEEDEKSKKSAHAMLASLANQATGKKGRAAVGALAAMISDGQRALATVDQIKRERSAEKKEASIVKALNERRITRHEAKDLRSKPRSFVSSFLDMRKKAIINVDDESIHIPGPKSEGGSNIPNDVMAAVEMACSSAPDGVDRVALRKNMIEQHQKRIAAQNGAGKVY